MEQANLDQINLEFMETLGAQLLGMLFPNGIRLNHHSEKWCDIVLTVKDNTITLDARNIPTSFGTNEASADEMRHELLSAWRLRLQMEGETVIEFGKGVHGVAFDKSKATRVMVKNMLSRFLPGLK